MADEQNKPKPPKLKITRAKKGVKLPKVKLSDTSVRGSKDTKERRDTSKKIPRVGDTSRKIPKVGLESEVNATTSRIDISDTINDRGPATVLRRAKLAADQPVVPENLSQQQQKNAEKSTTVRIEIDTAILRADKLKAKKEIEDSQTTPITKLQSDSKVVPKLDAKNEDKSTTVKIDPTTIEEQSKKIPAIDPKSNQTLKSTTVQIDPNLLVEDSQEIAAVKDEDAKETSSPIKEVSATSIPALDSKSPAAKSSTMQIDPAGLVDDSQKIPTIQSKEIEKKATIQIDTKNIVEESQEIQPPKDEQLKKEPDRKTSTQELMKASTLPMDAEKLATPEAPKKPKLKIPNRTAKLKKVKPASTVEKKPTNTKPTPIKAPEPKPPAEGIVEKPTEKAEEKVDIFKATTMAMGALDLNDSLEDTEKITTQKDKDIFNQVTQELQEPEGLPEAPKTVKIKKPSKATVPKTVKLKKGSPASDTSKVQINAGKDSSAPKKTVKLKRAKPAESKAGSGLRIRTADTDQPASQAVETILEDQLAPTGTDGPNIFMTVVSLLSLLTSSAAILFLWKALALYKNF